MPLKGTLLICSGAVGAVTENGEVPRIDREAEVTPSSRRETLEVILGGLDHRPARLADKMPVSLRGQVIEGRPVPEVRMDDHTEPLEFVEVPVNGRQVDVRSVGLYLSGQLLGSPVPGTFEEAVHQQTTRSGDPAAVSP